MNQKCGNCKWWDRDNSYIMLRGRYADCMYKLPESLGSIKTRIMVHGHGKNCPCFEQVEEVMICN